MRGRTLAVVSVVATAALLLALPLPVSVRIRAQVRDSMAPFQNGLARVAAAARAGRERLASVGRSDDDRARLREERDRLQLDVQRLAALREENAALRRQLAFRAARRERLIAAEVIGRGDVSGWWQKVRIDKGARDGVATNQPVITTDGLVGRTVVVSAHAADVLLVTDPTCRVAARLPRAGVFGIARGGGLAMLGPGHIAMLSAPPPVDVEFIDRRADIQVGDEVVTSGLGGMFPGGLPLGRVTRRALDRSGLYQRVDVAPAADLERLQYVFVLAERR